jgi:signal transduction histidine kinase/CheY-like chemotaxis protein/HAMP domain-containing protein
MTDAERQRPRLDSPALEQLLAGLTAVRGGDFSRRLALTGDPLVDEIASVFNAMADQLDRFTAEVTRVAREVGTEGKLGGQANVRGVSGTWKDLTESVNAMADNLTSQVRNIAQVTTAVAQGDLTKKIDVDARGEILELKTTINTMVDQLSSFAAEVTRVAREVGSEGRLGGQAEVEGVSGTWKRLTENVNELAENLTRQVRAISEVTSAVAAGDLTRSISVEAQGEVAELKDTVNAMVVTLRETVQASQEQDWLKSNLASIGAMMQGHRDLEIVAELIMDELAPLLGAQHGTFFLAEESGGETRLRLIAGYGLRADKDAPIQYRIGQSLIGQVAKSKRPIVVDEIPQGYIKISSGLGEAAPANLAVIPIVFEDHVMGVVELASFTKFRRIHIDFLEQFSESLGVSVNAIIANSRTDDLLEQSQRLTAELQARSEELQLSNADLEEKAAQLAAQKQDIEAKNAQIERARAEIEERARQLALASQYKSQFLANMSHELRTPLNSLLILARLLAQNQSRNLTAKQVEYARVIHSAGSDLLQLINDILDLSKVEAGRMDVQAERFPLASLMEDLRTTFSPLTVEKGLDFTVEIALSAPAELDTDRQRVRQVLGNLLSNAVKFTERGQVAVRVKESAEDPGTVVFSVTDSGIGIAPENLAAIFGAFQQGDGTLSRRYGGTGLGLSIASEVAALLGGKITAESDLGRGSTFVLHLPATLPDLPYGGAPDPMLLAVPEAAASRLALPDRDSLSRLAGLADAADDRDDRAAADVAAPPDAAGRNVLVLEGTSGGRLTLLAHSAISDLTEMNGTARVSAASSPAEGIAMLTAEPFRCVVVDLDLESAFDFLERLREKPELLEVPVLAHLAGRSPDRRPAELRSDHRSLELLPSLDELRERITLHLSAPERGRVPALVSDGATPAGDENGSRRPCLRGKHVLVVDDDSRNVFAITSALELNGMRVTHAANGRDGIDALTRGGDFDLVLMDVMMPGMDGYAAMTAIRRMPRFERLPIIAVTARAMQGDRDKSLDAGANDYVTKPVDTEDLLGCMERWLASA